MTELHEGRYFAYFSRHIDGGEKIGSPNAEFEIVRVKDVENAKAFEPIPFWYLTTSLKNRDLNTEAFTPGRWCEVDFRRQEGEEYACQVENPLTENVVSGSCVVDSIEPSASQNIESVFQLFGQRGTNSNLNIGSTTCVKVRIYYVGAALCIGIIDDSGNVVAYFDFGCISGNTSKNQIVLDMAPVADANQTNIISDITNNPNKKIILSHWHKDHINLAFRYKPTNLQYPFWGKVEWHVPDTRCPSASWLNRTVIPPQSFFVYNSAMKPSFNKGLVEIGKIRPNRPHPHPHHNGMFAVIKLKDNGEKWALLSGDCTYEFLFNSVCQKKFRYLQASHHGGNFAYLPAQRTNLSKYIPCPDAVYNRIAYSADSVTHGHPDSTYTLPHEQCGWIDRDCTFDAAKLAVAKQGDGYIDW